MKKRSARRVLSTSESSLSFTTTLKSYPGLPLCFDPSWQFKQAVYNKGQVGNGSARKLPSAAEPQIRDHYWQGGHQYSMRTYTQQCMDGHARAHTHISHTYTHRHRLKGYGGDPNKCGPSLNAKQFQPQKAKLYFHHVLDTTLEQRFKDSL